MPNIRIMIAFILAFSLFALSTAGVAISIIRQEVFKLPAQSLQMQKATYLVYSTCYFISQTTLVVLFYRINTQSLEMNQLNETK